ncbi:MAG TPA: hypothetical protein VMQ60_00725 [Acidobacteriaceae bacterium]|jgi:hypothetical protein|nr:hypothetical protein [Acidobacteriaceae bacterium]
MSQRAACLHREGLEPFLLPGSASGILLNQKLNWRGELLFMAETSREEGGQTVTFDRLHHTDKTSEQTLPLPHLIVLRILLLLACGLCGSQYVTQITARNLQNKPPPSLEERSEIQIQYGMEW